MSRHPCKAGPDGTPCNRIRRGEAYDISQDCRICWLFHHHSQYNLAWGGDGMAIVNAPSVPVDVQPATPKPLLLGDAIESALSYVGVTKERVAAAFGGCGGCPKRQKLLNELHQWALGATKQPIEKARGWLAKLIGE